jgi:hypothetical protein
VSGEHRICVTLIVVKVSLRFKACFTQAESTSGQWLSFDRDFLSDCGRPETC